MRSLRRIVWYRFREYMGQLLFNVEFFLFLRERLCKMKKELFVIFFFSSGIMRMVSALFVVSCDIGPSLLENRSGRTIIVRLSELNNERAVRA